MLSNTELQELGSLCEANELLAKYINKIGEENNRQFAQMIHELGNLVTLISSTAQLIESRNSEVHEIKYWNQLRNDIESLAEQFLTFSECKNCSQIECQETDIAGLVCEVAESFQAEAAKKNVSVIMEKPALNCGLLSYVCDPVRIKQAIVNLVKNALEAVGSGEKVWIRICGKEELNKEEWDKGLLERMPSCLKIEVADNGALISEEEMERIFEPSISSKGKNRGLGLPIAYRIIEAHQGIMKVSSQEENGERRTSFSIYLPA